MDQVWIDEMPPLTEWVQDPKGNALVEDILTRKAAANAREKMLQLFIWGDYQTDERGDVIPRNPPDFWDYLATAFRSAEKISYTKYLNRPPAISIDGQQQRPSSHWLRVGGRGYGKRAAAEAIRKASTARTPEATIASVRWACKKPTN